MLTEATLLGAHLDGKLDIEVASRGQNPCLLPISAVNVAGDNGEDTEEDDLDEDEAYDRQQEIAHVKDIKRQELIWQPERISSPLQTGSFYNVFELNVLSSYWLLFPSYREDGFDTDQLYDRLEELYTKRGNTKSCKGVKVSYIGPKVYLAISPTHVECWQAQAQPNEKYILHPLFLKGYPGKNALWYRGLKKHQHLAVPKGATVDDVISAIQKDIGVVNKESA